MSDALERMTKLARERGWTFVTSIPHSGNACSVLILLDHGARSYGPRDIFRELPGEMERDTFRMADGKKFEIGRHVIGCDVSLENALNEAIDLAEAEMDSRD